MVLFDLLGPVLFGLIGLWLLWFLQAWVGGQGRYLFDSVGGYLF